MWSAKVGDVVSQGWGCGQPRLRVWSAKVEGVVNQGLGWGCSDKVVEVVFLHADLLEANEN